NEEALATLKKALAAAGGESGVRGEIFALITDVYRSDNNLPELIRMMEGEHPGDFARLLPLGALYEETGDVNKALATYRRALAASLRSRPAIPRTWSTWEIAIFNKGTKSVRWRRGPASGPWCPAAPGRRPRSAMCTSSTTC